MLGLVEQVGSQQPRVGSGVGDDQALGRGEDLHAADTMALDLELGTRDGWAAGTQHLAAGGDRLGAKRQRGDTGRTVGAEDLTQTELLGDDQHGWIHLAVRTRDGRHDHGDLRNACHHGGGTDLHQHAGERALAARHEETGTRNGRALLADH